MQKINKNTYYQIPRYLIALVFSNSRNSGKYALNKTDEKNGFYFIVSIPATEINLKIPFAAVFKDNTKIKGIKGYNFSTARNCRSHRLGYCQIKHIFLCYAFQGEERAKNDLLNNGELKMNSTHQIELNMLFNQILQHNTSVFNRFIEYLNIKVPYLRFNVNGDFRHADDIKLLIRISKKYDGVCYGYTAADDLQELNQLKEVAAVNGSNKQYTNKYTCTFNLETYFNAILNGRECLGSCLGCCKCWELQDEEIINLFHKKDADIILNTFNNRLFMMELLNSLNVNISMQDLQRLKGLFSSINKYFITTYNVDLKDQDINNLKDLLTTIANSHYNLLDNIESVAPEPQDVIL